MVFMDKPNPRYGNCADCKHYDIAPGKPPCRTCGFLWGEGEDNFEAKDGVEVCR